MMYILRYSGQKGVMALQKPDPEPETEPRPLDVGTMEERSLPDEGPVIPGVGQNQHDAKTPVPLADNNDQGTAYIDNQETTIYNQYREYQGVMSERWLILFNAVMMEAKRTIKNKWVIIIMIFTWLWGILPVMALTLISISTGTGSRESIFDAAVFYDFYSYLFLFLVLFSAYIPAKTVTEQKANRMITLYLCRPISKLDYLLIKFCALALVLTFIIILPNVLLYFMVIGMLRMPLLWTLEHLWVLGSLILYGLLIVSIYSLLSLAIASSTKKSHWAITGIATFLYLTTGMSFIMRETIRNDYVSIISPWDNIMQVGAPLYGLSLPFNYPWPLAFAILALYVVISLAVILYNINQVEVVA